MKINLIFNKYIPDYKKALEKIEQALLSYKVEFKTFDLEKMEYFGDITFVIGGDELFCVQQDFMQKKMFLFWV